MLSASTLSSSNSSAFSASSGASTPFSQYSNDPRRNNNPLTELIETEQSYMETLKLIDSASTLYFNTQITPIWMRQTTSAAPDFSELLKHVHDILFANKKFCMKLSRIAANPQAINELGDVLMQWINELEVPYANYSRSFIPNLNQRYDILQNSAISNLLKNLSFNVAYEINLESLFNAPIQQLKYYKSIYNKLLESTDAGRADHELLVNANKQLDAIMLMSQSGMPHQTNNYSASSGSSASVLPLIQTSFSGPSNSISPVLTQFERQVDCSRTVDLYSGAQINYQLRIAIPGAQFAMRESFMMLSDNDEPSFRVHFFLTSDVLVISRESASSQFLLMYPAISIGDVTVKSNSHDRENVGEYILHFTFLGKKHIIVCTDSKELRNMWVGVDQDSPSSVTLAPKPLKFVAQRKLLHKETTKKEKGSTIRNTDIFTYYTDKGGVSPIGSSDEEEDWKDGNDSKARDSIMNIYDNHLREFEKEQVDFPLPPVPPLPSKSTPTTSDSSRGVQMTFIEAPIAQMSSIVISPPIPQNNENNKSNNSPPISSSSSSTPTGMNMNKVIPSPQSPSGGMKNFDSRPSSPRSVEVQRAIIPEAMQAVTQKTDDYLSSTAKGRPLMPKNNPVTLPRTSSMTKNTQQRHPMNEYGQSQSSLMSPGQSKSSLGPMMNQQRPLMMNQQRPPMMNQYRPMPSRPPHQQQFRPGPPPPGSPMSYNNNRPPSPMMRPPGSPLFQQPPGRFMTSPSLAPRPMDNANGNDIRQILYSSSQCDVFHWKDQTWYAAEGQCLLQIQLSHSSRTCVAIQLQNTRQLYLNAWILPNTVIRQPSPADVNISLFLGDKKENYLIHFNHPQDANVFADILRQEHQKSSQIASTSQRELLPEPEEVEPVDNVNVPQTLKLIMQCKAKLFIQNETNNWSTFGSVTLQISQQSPSMRMMIQIENDKSKLVSATVKSGNVERISQKRITFLLADEAAKTSIVYMIHLREEQSGNKIYEYLRIKNAENGW